MRSEPSWRTFDRIADSYDEVLPFFASIGRLLVDAIDPTPGSRHLDLGAGRGALVGPALERGCRVTAVDASAAMIARLTIEHPGAEARVMDVERLAFPDASFDLVTAAFVIHILDDPGAAVAEAHRVLTGGGRFAMTVGGALERPDPAGIQDELDALFAEFADQLPPGGGMGAPIDAPLLLREAGFVDLETRHTEVSVPVPDGEALWAWALSHGYRSFIDDLPPAQRERMRERMSALPGPGAVLQRANAVLIGRKP